MSTKRMWLLNTGRSTFHWWLRLMVAAFLLSAWVAVGFGQRDRPCRRPVTFGE